jgi:ribonucleotide reductase alpha subunit
MAEANFAKMTSMHFYAWKNGLKTGQYYLRTRPSRDAIKFTVNIEQLLSATDSGNNDEILKCLSLNENNLKSLGAGGAGASAKVGELGPDDRRESRFLSTNSVPDDDHAGAIRKPKPLLPPAVEEEEITFECINCSG